MPQSILLAVETAAVSFASSTCIGSGSLIQIGRGGLFVPPSHIENAENAKSIQMRDHDDHDQSQSFLSGCYCNSYE